MSTSLGFRPVYLLWAVCVGLALGACSAPARPAGTGAVHAAGQPAAASPQPAAAGNAAEDPVLSPPGMSARLMSEASEASPAGRGLSPAPMPLAGPAAPALAANLPAAAANPSAVTPTHARPLSAAGAAGPAGLSSAPPFTGTLLIADAGNNRLLEVTPDKRIIWRFPAAGSQPAGGPLHYPDDGFFSPDGRYITVNQELSHTIAVIAYPEGMIVWQYGQAGVAGSDLRHLHNPDDAHLLPTGELVVADIRNCRLLFIPWDQLQPHALGSPTDCTGRRGSFAKPNGVTPLSNGHLLVTEISSRRVSEIDLQGRLIRAAAIHLNYLSDAYPTARDTLIVSDYHNPGRVVEADWSGRILWSFPPAGSAERLDRPSIAFELPNGNVVISDDHRDRVVIVDRRGQVVWQYGVTDVPGQAPGYLNTPDGLDQHLTSLPVSP